MITIDTKNYIDDRLREFEKRQNIVNKKDRDALREAKREMDRRLEGMNEFRAQLTSQTREFIRREEYQLSEKLINQKHEGLSKIVYIGIGVVIVLELLLKFLL